MNHRNQQPFPSRPRDWFVAGLGLGFLWALATNPVGLGCLMLLLLIVVTVAIVVVAVIAVQYWWLTVAGAALLVWWLQRRYRETKPRR